jgi:hypothetical protein
LRQYAIVYSPTARVLPWLGRAWERYDSKQN